MKHLLLVLLVFAVLAQPVYATTYDVTATVPATAPTTAPVFDSSLDGSRISAVTTTVFGSCEVDVPPVIVSVWRSGSVIGSALCGAGGTFSLVISLVPGANILVPRSSSFTGQFGPDGSAITLQYDLPQPPIPAPQLPPEVAVGQQRPVQPVVQNPPQIVSQDASFFFTPNNVIRVVLEIKAGEAPYRVVLKWGDGTIAERIVEQPGTVVFEHTYKQSGQYQVVAVVTDVKGVSSRIELAAVSMTPEILQRPAYSAQKSQSTGTWVLAGMFIALLLAITCTWWLLAMRRRRQKAQQHHRQKQRKPRR